MSESSWMGRRRQPRPDPQTATPQAIPETQPLPGSGVDEACIQWFSNPCPYCRGIQHLITRVEHAGGYILRRHKCKECERAFRSVEDPNRYRKPAGRT